MLYAWIKINRKLINQKTKTLTDMNNYLGYSDAKSKSIVWNAYAENFAGEEISEEGFNINTGYVYIALEYGVTIASAFGQPVEFIVYDDETGEEMFFDSMDEANKFFADKL